MKILKDTPPWDWPEDASRMFFKILTDGQTDTSDRMLVAELAGDFTVINEELEADWEAVAADVRKRHSRKKGFMTGFKAIVSGAPKHVEPPFLEHAKARWPKQSEDR